MITRQISTIRYTKVVSEGQNEVTDRVIIPTFIPTPNIKAIDVTESTEEERQQLQVFMDEYNAYLEAQSVGTFKFEDWMEHTKQIFIQPKWRTFKQDQTEELS